ncbi:MAG: hypothetical protein LQ350_004919 [Teloschistes chrysophthalmus]|nr:MAG: hypothetical protein LQ350_004919 [Niorma chrysophthalma]
MDASRSRDLDGNFMMEDNISPTSSRTSTPAPEALFSYEFAPSMDMVTELSSRFEHQTLASCGPDTDPLSPPSLNIEPPKRHARSSRSRSSSLLVWQQRQTLARRQCTQAHLSQISALVKEMSPDSTHPSFTCSGPLSPTSNPSSPGGAFDSNPSSSGSEDCCEIELDTFDCGSAAERPHMTRVGKAWRRATSVEALERKQKLVLKKVRMRKSLIRIKADV